MLHYRCAQVTVTVCRLCCLASLLGMNMLTMWGMGMPMALLLNCCEHYRAVWRSIRLAYISGSMCCRINPVQNSWYSRCYIHTYFVEKPIRLMLCMRIHTSLKWFQFRKLRHDFQSLQLVFVGCYWKHMITLVGYSLMVLIELLLFLRGIRSLATECSTWTHETLLPVVQFLSLSNSPSLSHWTLAMLVNVSVPSLDAHVLLSGLE